MNNTVPIIFVYDETLLFELHLPAPAGRYPDKQSMIKHKRRIFKVDELSNIRTKIISLIYELVYVFVCKSLTRVVVVIFYDYKKRLAWRRLTTRHYDT